jgi:hypothetical protein
LGAIATVLVVFPLNIAAAAPLSPATVQDGDLAKRKILARQLTELVGTKATVNRAINSLSELMSLAFKGSPEFSKLPQADQDKLSEFLLEEFHTTFADQLIDQFTTEYANAFSEDELTQLIAIYNSPLMQKAVGLGLNLQGKMQTVGQKLGQEAGERAAQRWLKWRKTQGVTK